MLTSDVTITGSAEDASTVNVYEGNNLVKSVWQLAIHLL